jgi:hypothetical protein
MKPLTAGMHLSPMLAARDAVAALAARREGRTAPLRYDVPGQAYEYERPAGQRDPDEHRGPGVHACPKSKSTTTKSGSVRQRTS